MRNEICLLLTLSSLGITAFNQMFQVYFQILQYRPSHLNTEPAIKIILSKIVTISHTSLNGPSLKSVTLNLRK